MLPQIEEKVRSTVACILAFILRRKILQQVTAGNRIECFPLENAQGTPQLDLKILFLIKNTNISRKDILSGTCRPSTCLAFSFLEHKRIAHNMQFWQQEGLSTHSSLALTSPSSLPIQRDFPCTLEPIGPFEPIERQILL